MSLKTIADKLEAFASGIVSAAVEEAGELGGKLLTDLMADDSLSGLEKANLAATQLVEHAATNSITIAEQDVTALIKNAYLAVKSKIASL